MKLKIFTIYDSKTESYAQPNFLINRGTFNRALLEAMNDPQSNLSKYPADFTAFEIGEWDDSSATITMYPAKINLGNLLELMPSRPTTLQPVTQQLTQERDH